jgi:pyruvate/2-oxoglutarate dehydrogenase complex dihydrolipoamide dehydrogenase (E3) component
MKRQRKTTGVKTYDFIAIGGGSAGFNAARVAASLGLKTAVVDGATELGGLCILRGCMPSKTLLYMAEVLHLARQGPKFGLKIPSARADLAAMQARKRRIIRDFADYREKALQAGRFDLIRAHARFTDSHTLELSDGSQIRGRHFLIGTGSVVATPPIPGLAESEAWTSDDVLNLDFIPPSVIVLGGGIVACELAQFLQRVGSRVTLIQRSDQLLRDHSREAADVVRKALEEEGIEVLTGTSLTGVARQGQGYRVTFAQGGRTRVRSAKHLFNALGRVPNTAGLRLETAGVSTDSTGRVRTNRWQQTSQPHIYAAGDCSGPVEIVHVAIQQAELAARHAAKVKALKRVDYSLLLNVVFTDPQVASVGISERTLRDKGVAYLSATYPFNDHGKSILMEANHGFVKVWAEPKRGRILGAEIVGKDAGELIHCLTGPIALGATVHDLLRAPWYHPTLAEIITYPLEEIADQVGAKRA